MVTKAPPSIPWQLTMFNRSLKKQLKLDALLNMLGLLQDERCLLISCGDNNGALNWHFRQQGGHWQWADIGGESLAEMSELLAEPVDAISDNSFPYADGTFDRIISIDCLEHLEDDQPFLAETLRVLKTTGRAIVTVPNGDPALWANRIKSRVGMTPEKYGHTRAGYTVAELSASMTQAAFQTDGSSGYSRFFTEMVELLINFSYVFVLARKEKNVEPGQIAPASSGQLKTHGAAYRLYSIAFPIFRLISKLDGLLPSRTNNAVIVVGKKPAG